MRRLTPLLLVCSIALSGCAAITKAALDAVGPVLGCVAGIVAGGPIGAVIGSGVGGALGSAITYSHDLSTGKITGEGAADKEHQRTLDLIAQMEGAQRVIAKRVDQVEAVAHNVEGIAADAKAIAQSHWWTLTLSDLFGGSK